MKAKFLLILLLSLSCAGVRAETGDDNDVQPKPKKKVHATTTAAPTSDDADTSASWKQLHLGIIGGLSLASQGINSVASGVTHVTDSRTGFSGGTFLEIPFSEHFSLVPEVLYVQKGGSTIDSSAGLITYSFDTLEVPILAQLKWGNEMVKFTVFAGPALAIAVNKSASQSSSSNPSTTDLRGLDLTLHTGVGTEVTVTRGINLLFNVRYIPGILDQDKVAGTSTRFSTWLMMTGIAIGL